MSVPVPALVTVHLWRVTPAQLPQALARMALDRVRIRRTPGVRFAKMLGTGNGRTFTTRDADPLRWGLLATWTGAEASRDVPVLREWQRLAAETLRVDLTPLVSRGRWSGQEPFGDPVPHRYDGPVAAVTRARLRAARTPAFWRAVPPVSAELRRTPGLRAAVGIGEAPVGLQGTFSMWDSGNALREFAHRSPAHVGVVGQTGRQAWYAEELFARFAVVAVTGTLDGRTPNDETAP